MSNPKLGFTSLKTNKRKKGDDSVVKPEKFMRLEDNRPDNELVLDNDNLNNDPVKYKEYYMQHGYALRKQEKEQYYAKDLDQNEIYFKDQSGNETYAYTTVMIDNKEQRTEFPAKLKDDTHKYIYKNGIPTYPENLDTGALIFPKNSETKEEIYLPNEDGKIMYPTNRKGRQYYRRDANNDEIPISEYGYAKDENGNEIYPKLSNGDEYYLKNETAEIGAKRFENGIFVSYYARKQNGDEIYPREWLLK